MGSVDIKSVNQKNVEIFNRLTKMSITQLKAMLAEVLKEAPLDKKLIKIIKGIIQKKKTDYPIEATRRLEERTRLLDARR